MGYMGFGMRKEVYTRKPKKSFEKIRRLYEQELKRRLPKNLELKSGQLDDSIKEQIIKKIKQQRRKQIILSVSVSAIVILAIATLLYFQIGKYMEKYNKRRHEPKVSEVFKRKVYWRNDEITKIVDYYHGGPMASIFRYKDGMKHQNSDSYYPTGEHFRSAIYHYDSLITEYYLFKNGDTINDFPKLEPEKKYYINLITPDATTSIEFDVFDYKIIVESYQEKPVVHN